jgi:hypothetical protein
VRTLHLVPKGRLKFGPGVQPFLAGLSSLLIITQDDVLGYFQTSLRD